MRKTLAALTIGLSVLSATSAFADQYVRGYVRDNGTVVSPYVRSTPDGNPYNNYGSR